MINDRSGSVMAMKRRDNQRYYIAPIIGIINTDYVFMPENPVNTIRYERYSIVRKTWD